MFQRALTIVAAAMLLLLAGCGSSNNTLAPFQPEVANIPDTFQFQATGITNVTTTVVYTWSNSGTTANVDQSGTISAGVATLTIFDADTVQVYSSDLSNTGSFTTAAGTPGNWTITVGLDKLSGTLNFRAQKP